MLWAECRKLFSWKPLLLVLALFLFVNAVFICRQEQNETISADMHRILWEEVEDKTDTEKLAYLQEQLEARTYYTEDGTVNYERYVLMDRWREQLESILSYDDYLSSIENEANAFSSGMFPIKKNTFIYRKNMHLPKVYTNVKNVAPRFDVSDGILKTTGNRLSDFLCGIFLWIAAVQLIVRDREQNTAFLLRSTPNGRREVLFCRTFLMFLMSIIVGACFYAETLIIYRQYYRFGDLLRPIQSLDGFIGCSMPISVLQYLMICFLVKCLFLTLIGLICLWICQSAKSNLHLYLVTALLFGTEILLYQKTNGIFSSLNLFSFSDVNQMIKTYQALNLSGFPISLFGSAIFMMTAVIIFGSVYVIYREEKQHVSYHRFSLSIRHIGAKRKGKKVMPCGVYTLSHSLSGQKAGYTCIILIVISALQFVFFEKPYDVQDTYYRAYVTQAEGPITDNTKQFFQQEEARFDEIEQQYQTLSESGVNTTQLHTLEKQMEPRTALEKLEDHTQQISRFAVEDAALFYDSGYLRLFLNTSNEKVWFALIICAFLVFVISPLIAGDFENGMIRIIRSTTSGRNVYYRSKILLAISYALFAVFLLWFPYFFAVKEAYTLPFSTALVQNIRGFEKFPLTISIALFAVFYGCIWLICVIFAAMLMLLISRVTKSRISACILNICIFVLPLILKLIGIF